MSVLILLLTLGGVNSFISPNALRGGNLLNYQHRLLSRNQDESSIQSQYNELGLTNDDALWNWIKNNNTYLEEVGTEISAQKLSDSFENSLYSVFIKFHNKEIEDRVVHFFQSRGPTTRFYTILGKNSNGLSLEEYNKFLWTAVGKCVATSCIEIAALGFVISGGFGDLVHQLNSNGSIKEVIATTGVISFLSSKAIEVAAGHSARGLNPFYHLSTYQLLAPNSRHLSKYTREAIPDVLNDRLNDAYHGFLNQGGLNPEMTVSFKARSKSDQNWMRELKKAILAIAKKRYELIVKNSHEECAITEKANPVTNSTINLHIENISINIGSSDSSEPSTELICDEEKLSRIKSELADKINYKLADIGNPIDDAAVSELVNEVVSYLFPYN
ncbi:MAG: hypothetical protein AB8G05_05425 [Oligoflexales bacterium]